MTNVVVGLAEMRVSADPEVDLVTYALGSCLGVSIHDRIAGVGGLAHLMLPLAASDPARAESNPLLYVDSGVPALFHACYAAGAEKSRLIVKVAGGATLVADETTDPFQIGHRNFVVLRRLLWQNGVFLSAHDVGGRHPRTMTLRIASGVVTLKSNQETREL